MRIKALAWMIIFILTLLAGDRVIGSLLDRVLLLSQFRFSLVYKGGHQYDVLIIGNSRGVNSFYAPAVQETTGLSTLNLSYNGMSADLAEALFKDYLERNKKPKILILEVSNLTHRGDLLSELKLYTPHSERLTKLFCKHNPSAALWTRASHVFQFNSEMFLRALYYLTASDQTWINRYQISPALVHSLRTSQENSLTMFPENLKALERILGTARQENIAVRLVISPYLPNYAQRLSNIRGWVQQVEAVTMGIRVMDYSAAVTATSAFADRLHLNYDGSMLLLKMLVRDGVFQTGKDTAESRAS
jgi:hypothetical protein